MIRHLLKLAWHRKRGNLLLVLEILVSFVVVFSVAALALHIASSYRRPLGFDWRDVFAVSISAGESSNESWDEAKRATMGRLLREGATVDGVEAIAASFSAPYDGSTMVGDWDEYGRHLEAEFAIVDDAFRDVMRLELTRGRWFQESDSALSWQPVVVNERLAREVFGDQDPVGKRLYNSPGEPERRIVGVVRDFRTRGELSAAGNFLFQRLRLAEPKGFPPRTIVVRARPGAGADFEERFVRRLRDVEPSWTFDANSLAQSRETSFRLRLTPLAIGGLIAVFLLLMVSLGLIGVLWQNVTRRTREIGLRRALGAAGVDVRRQVLVEIGITTSAGIVLGVVVVVQVPLLKLFASVGNGTYAAAMLASAAVIGAIALAAGLYPSWLASRVQPADALREE